MARARWEEFDVVGFSCLLILLGVGALFLWSVSERPDLLAEGTEYRGTLQKQMLWAGIGLVGFFVVLRVPCRRWMDLAPLVYGGGLAALAMLLAVGTRVNDATRWFSVGGGVTVQPSEFMKVALILPLARLLMFERRGGGGILAKVGAVILPPFLLVMLQPDMGTALLFLPVGLAMAYVGGVRLRLLLLLVLAAGLAGSGYAALGLKAYRAKGDGLDSKDRVWGLHAYQWRRVESYLEPDRHRSAGAFQAEQARIAIGSGGLLGKGIRNGTQSQLKILPVRRSDFIYAVVGEEWGLAGTGLVLLAWAGILIGCFSAAARAMDPFGRLLATGVGVLLASEVLLNTGVVVGLLPVTGTPLPLVSQGGSSLVATCLALGVVQGVRMRPGFDLGKG